MQPLSIFNGFVSLSVSLRSGKRALNFREREREMRRVKIIYNGIWGGFRGIDED